MNTVSAPLKPSLGVALRHDWRHLLGVALFPSVTGLSFLYLHVPEVAFIPFFFAVAFYAMWPCLAKRAPMTFWFVAGAVWMAGGFFLLFLLYLLSLVHLYPITHSP